jgi:two-component system, OmpR family, sensor kinase
MRRSDTSVRTRLVVAFTYISVTIIVALTIPLAVTLDRRARAELERENLVRAGTIAQDVGAENLTPNRRRALRAIVQRAAEQADGRVIVVDAAGRLIGDSQGPATGDIYATPQRPEIVAALHDTPTSEIRFSQDLGVDIMATAVPIVDESPSGATSVAGAVRITRSMDQVNANVRRVTWGVVAIGSGGLAAGLILAFALSGSLARPLRRLADVAHRFGSGDLSVRAGEVRGPREVEELASSFDQMADHVERTVQVQREFVANASHQLRTPLTGMKLRLESALADTDDEELGTELVAADAEVDRLSAIVDRLLATASRAELATASRAEEEQATTVNLGELAERAAERWQQPAREARAELVVDGQPGRTLARFADVEQILDNLLDNALTHAPGRIELTTGTRDGQAIIAVRDHGPGISDDDLPLVTERFYRGSGPRASGSGLGLAIVRELAEHAGGSVTISRPPGGGTLVEVAYPPSERLTEP